MKFDGGGGGGGGVDGTGGGVEMYYVTFWQ